MSARPASLGVIADTAFPKLVEVVCGKINHPAVDVFKASELLVDGHTVPFISRYRRETIGNLTPTDLFDLDHRLDKFAATVKSRDAKLKKLEEDGKLTERLRKAFMNCTSNDEIDELWAPFKEKHATNSAKAQSIPGLLELAEHLLERMGKPEPEETLDKLAAIKIPAELKSSIPSIHVGVQFIVTDLVAHDPDNRKLARECFARQFSLQSGIVLPRAVPAGSQLSLKEHKERVVKGSNYRDYHDYNRLLHHIPSHQLLAIRRGCGQGSSSSGDAKKSSAATASGSSSDRSSGTALSTKVCVTDYGLEKLERRLRAKCQLPHTDPAPVGGASTLDAVCEQLRRRRDRGGSLSGMLVPWNIRNRLVGAAVTDAIKKSISPSLTKEAHKESLRAADAGAVEVFAGNLHRLLLTPPLASYFDTAAAGGANNICVVDPGFAHGHKCAVFSLAGGSSGTGSSRSSCIKETRKLVVRRGPREGEEVARASEELAKMCQRHRVRLVVVGDGVGSHQAINIVRGACVASVPSGAGASSVDVTASVGHKRKIDETVEAEGDYRGKTPAFPSIYTVVSECGASVYSASEVATQEYPDVDISFLGCISIGARLVDPLAELVKIPPESLGIGLYQHDIAPKTLQHKLKEVVEICVNDVGVDLNTANVHILKYISGIDDTKARNIVAHRDGLAGSSRLSGFRSLEQMKDVKGIGAITFKNAAGFLRVYEGDEALDSTCIHPEHYKVARKLLVLLGESRGDTGAGKKSTGFTSADIGVNVSLHRTISDTMSALADTAHPRNRETVSRTDEWMAKLGLSRATLSDMLDWLSLRSTGVGTGSRDAKPAKKSKIDEETGAGAGPRTDDIRVLRGVPPELVRASTITTFESAARNRTAAGAGAEGAATGAVSETRVLEIGMKITGKVKNIAPFGVFVDLGGGVDSCSASGNSRQRDGLLHISAFNKQPKGNGGLTFAGVTVGQLIEVTVMSIDIERGRVGLGLQ